MIEMMPGEGSKYRTRTVTVHSIIRHHPNEISIYFFVKFYHSPYPRDETDFNFSSRKNFI